MRLPFTTPVPREGMPDPKLDRATFERRFRSQFPGPAFDRLGDAVDSMARAAWEEYDAGNKAPRTRKAGPGYRNPAYDLAADWIEAKAAIDVAQARHRDPALPHRVLLVNASPRSEHTCPGEMSKSWRLAEILREVLEEGGATVDVLDLSRLASEYERHIHPARRASRRPRSSATSPARATPTTPRGRRRTG